MSSHDALRSLVADRSVAVEKLAEAAVVGRMVRAMKKEAASPFTADGLKSLLSTAKGAVQPHLQKATDWVRSNPGMAAPLIGAGVGGIGGAVLGGGSNLVGKKRRKDRSLMSDTVTGGLLGGLAGLGLGTAVGANIPRPKAPPASQPAPAAPAAPAAKSPAATPAAAPAPAVFDPKAGRLSPEAFRKLPLAEQIKALKHYDNPSLPQPLGPIGYGTLAAGTANETLGQLSRAATHANRMRPHISTNPALFQQGVANLLSSSDGIERLKRMGFDDNAIKALGTSGKLIGNDKRIQALLVNALAGNSSPVSALQDNGTFRDVMLTPQQVGVISDAGTPADRIRDFVSPTSGPSAARRAGWGIGDTGGVQKLPGLVNAARRAWHGRRIPIYDSMGPKGRMATRASLYSLPIILEQFMRARNELRHADTLQSQLGK